ncbi:MAG: hypothetical protein N3E44_03210 [Candidatus Bathyarchaeota archaeon]|nr:hypothetical protein [Candidatus Bathyarchaeota archaeon]
MVGLLLGHTRSVTVPLDKSSKMIGSSKGRHAKDSRISEFLSIGVLTYTLRSHG